MKKYLILVVLSLFLLSGCGKKAAPAPSPTPAPKLVEMEIQNRPEISLTPRVDGHELTLKLNKISDTISKIEYEITYLATDANLEIEKGASGILENSELASGKAERKILLGTESCTNGCKYKYDTGVSGGKLSLIFSLKNGSISIFETPFILKSTADLKKSGGQLLWSEENFTYTPKNKLSGSNYFIAHKNFLDGSYLVTSSGAL